MLISKSAGPARIFLCAAGALLAASIVLAGADTALAGSGRGDAVRSASTARPSAAPGSLQPTLTGGALDTAPAPGATLKARKPLRKVEITSLPATFNGTMVVKLADDVPAYGVAATGRVEAVQADERVDLVNATLERFGMKARPAINASLERMAALEAKAAARSGKAQPRLANMLHVTGPLESMLAAARELNGLDSVEWVELQPERKRYGPPTGACCLPTGASPCTENLSIVACLGLGGVYQGDATTCDGPCSACCIDDTCFDLLTETTCSGAGGNWIENQICADEEFECENECGSDQVGDCFQIEGNGGPFCDDEDCCELICACDPFCCQEDGDQIGVWDEFCAAQANLLCLAGDRCASAFNGPCFEAHPTPGCNVGDCCGAVCFIDQHCCNIGWDDACVAQAITLCLPPLPSNPAAPTPDLTNLQGYLTSGGYGPAVPAALAPFIPTIGGFPFLGYGGEGWNMGPAGEPFTDTNGNHYRDAGEPFTDLNLNGIWDRAGGGEPFADQNHNGWWDLGEPYIEQSPLDGTWNPGEPFTDLNSNGFFDDGEPFTDQGNGVWNGPSGLHGFGETLLFKLGIDQTGEGNLTSGKTTKAAVIEWGIHPDHEDVDIVVEPGQTIVDLPEFTGPDHATACASIIGARNNGFGITGVAPEIEAVYFFPLTSLEEGPRESSAWFNAIEFLDFGDVISASYGPSPDNLNCRPDSWTMFRMASDLGITVCVAAGNDAFNLDGATDFGDSGAIVVGACSPGAPWWRLSFSNYCTEPALERGNIVHLRAWGDLVAAGGNGNVFRVPLSVQPGLGDNPDRRYTATFGGTSAAAPQIAGFLACLQGAAKMFYGTAVGPEVLRAIVGAPGGGPDPDRDLIVGGFPAQCIVDIDPTAGPNRFGAYPAVANSLENLVTQDVGGFDDAPTVDDVIIVRGTHIFGNVFSLKRAGDNVRLLIETVYTERNAGAANALVGVGPNGVDLPPMYQIGEVTYLGTGEITDVVVVGHNIVQIPTSFAIEYQPVAVPVPTFVFIEAYDWVIQKWTFVGFQFLGPGAEGGIFQYPGGDATRFIHDAPDELILGRVWTLGFTLGNAIGFAGPGGQAGRTSYLTGMDYFNFAITDQIGQGP